MVNEIAWMGGADSASDEWVELYNNGTTSQDLSGWTLSIEGKKTIALVGQIGASGFYLIERTDDNSVPNIAADLVASFGTGLSNAGAILSLKDSQGLVIDRADGSDNWKIGGGEIIGDNNTKATANRTGSGWATGTATPRAVNAILAGGGNSDQNTNPGSSNPADSVSTTTNASGTVSNWPVEPQIFARASGPTIAVAGADNVFKAQVFGLDKKPIENARMIWTFGDGARKEGGKVLHAYSRPGTYVAVLEAASSYWSASDRLTVTVGPTTLSIDSVEFGEAGGVALRNFGDREINLSLWQLEVSGEIFMIPENTIILPKTSLFLSAKVTGLPTNLAEAFLRYPNGEVAVKYQPSRPQVTVSAMPANTSSLAQNSPQIEGNRALGTRVIEGDAGPLELPFAPVSNLAAVGVSQIGPDNSAGSFDSKQPVATVWFWTLGGVLLVGIGSVIFMSRGEASINLTEADEIEIID